MLFSNLAIFIVGYYPRFIYSIDKQTKKKKKGLMYYLLNLSTNFICLVPGSTAQFKKGKICHISSQGSLVCREENWNQNMYVK